MTDQPPQLSSDLNVSVKNASGPPIGEDLHTFCSTCNRVIWSVWKYGPMTPREHNQTFCVCGGEVTGEIKKKFVIYDVGDVDPDYDRSNKRTKKGKS